MDDDIPVSFLTSEPAANQLDDLFTEIETGGAIPGNGQHPNGYLAEAAGWESTYEADISPTGTSSANHYHLPIIGYEGGQNLISQAEANAFGGASDEFDNLFFTANLDTRMATAYTNFLTTWKSNGGHIFMNFADITPYSQYGEWGALQSAYDNLNPAPRKWQALQDFITNNPCWWTGCSH
jgi:hypothetical protein